jgi:hypothetical protein
MIHVSLSALIEKLTDKRQFSSNSPRLCDIAAQILERIGSPDAVAALEEWEQLPKNTD